jgi:hypothetical protein
MFPIIHKSAEQGCKEDHSDILGGLGARYIGHGSFARVYTLPSKKQVVKVGAIRGNESYLKFVDELSKMKKNNPYFPKIAKVEFYGNLTFAVFMEKLAPWEDPVVGELAEDIENRVRFAWATSDAALYSAGALLRRVREGHCAFEFDLHQYNIMLRGKQLVFIDPLCNFSY